MPRNSAFVGVNMFICLLKSPRLTPSNKLVPKMQLQAAFSPTLLDHACALSIESETCADRMTGVICKLGVSTNVPKLLLELIDCGMNIAMVTRESEENPQPTIAMVREACAKYSKKLGHEYPLAIAISTMGHAVYTGNNENSEINVVLEKAASVKLTADKAFRNKCTKDVIFIDYPGLVKTIKPGQEIYMRNQSLKLQVTEVGTEDITCSVICGGFVTRKSLVGLPAGLIRGDALTDEDKKDIDIAIDQRLDIIIVSFVKTAGKINQVREIIGSRGNGIRIVASIEDEEGLNNIDEILEVADGIQVARENLSVNLNQAKLFLVQKILIAKCNQARKPVVIASQLLKSMYDKPRATRPEISDVAHAVMDGADCLLLNETANGHFPLLCLKTMVDICKEAEGAIWQTEKHTDLDAMAVPPTDSLTAVAIAAVEASLLSSAAAIIVIASPPNSAQTISSFRPRCPIIAVTRFHHVARQLQLYKSVFPVFYDVAPRRDWQQDLEARWQFALQYGICRSFVSVGDAVILVSGWQHGAGFTNTIRIIYVSCVKP